MFGQGTFINTGMETPDQLAAKRAAIAAMMPQYGKAKYIGEGIGQLLQGIGSGRAEKQLDQVEAQKKQQADQSFFGILGYQQPQNARFQQPRDPMAPENIGADTMTVLGKGRAGEIYKGLTDRGFPDHIAQAFVDNMRDESGLNPAINEQSPMVAGSRGGFGLNQWTGPRRVALEQFAASRGVPASDMNAQLDFLKYELQGPEKAAAAKIFAAPDRGQAAAAIVTDFLRPAEVHRSTRSARYLGNDMPNANAALPQIPTDQLMSALSNPWLDQNQRQVLTTMLNNQMQAGDPMRQMELQKTQLELQRMQQPQTPEYRMLTPQEAQSMGLPDGAYQVGADGKVSAVGGGGSNVTVNNQMDGGPPSDDPLRKKLMENEGTAWGDYSKAGNTSAGMKQDMELLSQVIEMAPQGPVSGRLAQMFPGVSDAAGVFQSVVKRVAPSLRVEGSGSQSDVEYNGFLQSLPSLSNKPEANRAIAAFLQAKSQINIDRGNIVSQYQNGEINAPTARKAMAELSSRSIMTPEMQTLLGAMDGGAGAAPTPVPSGIDQADWDVMTPEERALFK